MTGSSLFFPRAALAAATWAGVLALSGCASREATVPRVQQGGGEGGARTVQVAPERLACETGPRCPVLAVSWTSRHAGQARLMVALPGTSAQVRGADVHIGGSETVRLRVPAGSAAPANAPALPGAAQFDVPLRLVDRLAHAPRTWMRVYTEGGGMVDEFVFNGEQRSRASEAMAHFLTAVQGAGGKGEGLDGARGGLFERLGVGADK
ncbi:hypothetical protein SAMN05428957_10825 [Oryzisolibacter propanilivorax]|uniref:Lipoprotein n=1 Tax=Oryzisolibacter propanilivorax TaxID=1527607 RepID=A0A1G9U975_9BURK|nr:hypothetical protein [Oryzisolibacter propanilivorax]SDM56095.1 hypothetical protein SAMN05428957_10825 [Oryzisolibacter propanilivorax]